MEYILMQNFGSLYWYKKKPHWQTILETNRRHQSSVDVLLWLIIYDKK